jgi:signal transduction histidine kinase
LREQPEQHPFAQAMQGTRTISHTYPHDNEPVIVAVGNDNQSSQQRAPIAALLAMPLMARGQVIGVMGMLHDQPIQPVATEDVHLVGELAYRIALALDTTISYDKALHARIEAEQALRMRDQVFHLISHDLKTPLTTVHGYVYLLRRQISALDVPNKDKLLRDNDKIAATTKQMAQQIDEILHVAELQAGELPEMMRQPVDVLELARRIADAHQQISDRHTIRVSTSLDELVVKGDKTQLERVFTNLLSNAVKYSPEGSEINVTLHTEERNNTPGALAAISDQGLGIPNADLPYLFEPFRRGSNVQKHTSGTGLGLVSVRYIVEQHGGTIVVNSEEGKGSTFTIWLPQHEEP